MCRPCNHNPVKPFSPKCDSICTLRRSCQRAALAVDHADMECESMTSNYCMFVVVRAHAEHTWVVDTSYSRPMQ